MDVTISGLVIEDWRRPGTTGFLRFYYSGDWVDADGGEHVGVEVGSRDFFLEVPLTVDTDTREATPSGGSFTLPATTDALENPGVTVHCIILDAARGRVGNAFLFSDWRIPHTLGSSVEYSALVLYNQTRRVFPSSGHLDADQTAAFVLSLFEAGNPATAAALGRVRISPAPADPAVPVAAGINHAALNAEYFAASYASLSAAVAAIGSAPATLVISSPLTLPASLTTPSKLTLRFVGDGSVSVASGQTLTVCGAVLADARRIFLGAGSVRFLNPGQLAVMGLSYPYDVNVVWFAAGSGTLDDPWTEWDTRVRWAQRMTFRFPSGFYEYAESPKFALAGIRLIGSASTYMLYTGAGKAFDCLPPAEFIQARDIHVENFILDGVNASHGLYMENVLQSRFINVHVRNLGGTAFYSRSCNLNVLDCMETHDLIEDSVIGNNLPPVTVMPTVGMHFDDGGYFLTNNALTIINPDITGINGIGVKIESLVSSVFLGGAVERCDQEGFTIAGGGHQTSGVTILGTEIEYNNTTGGDVVTGSKDITFLNVFSFNGTINVIAGAENTVFQGGCYNAINIFAGAKATALKNIRYNFDGSGDLSDLGYGTTYESVFNSTAGTQHSVSARHVTPQLTVLGAVTQPVTDQSGVIVFGTAGTPISNDQITAAARWKIVFRGVFIDTLNGDGGIQNAPYLEVSSEYPTVGFPNDVTLTFTQAGGSIRGVASGATAVIFYGTVEQIPTSHLLAGQDSIVVPGRIKTLGVDLALGRLAQVPLVNLNTTNKTILYGPPTGRDAIVTEVVMHGATVPLTTLVCGLGWNFDADDVIAPTAWAELTASNRAAQRFPVAGLVKGSVGSVFGLKCTVPQGVPATATVEVFGFLV